MGEITNTKGKIDTIVDSAYTLFRTGEFQKSIEVLSEALSIDFDREEIVSALKCASFWNERQSKLATINDKKKKGDFLLEQWKIFIFFLEKLSVTESCLYAIRQFVFGNCLEYFQGYIDKGGAHDSDLIFKMGKCYKGLGDYEHALEYFEATNHQKPDDPEILAELADCYAFINEVRASKVFFREAFFLDPQKVDLFCLESMLIQRLVLKLKDLGYNFPELPEWIPVYGVVFRIFNVARELKPLEYGKLKQSIITYENELQNGTSENSFLVPRLINRYFWMIDYLINNKNDREHIDKILLKLKNLNESIYNQYLT